MLIRANRGLDRLIVHQRYDIDLGKASGLHKSPLHVGDVIYITFSRYDWTLFAIRLAS